MPQPLSRRTLLKGLGVSLALPLFDCMLPTASRAAMTAKSPKRMAFLFVPNGANMAHWTPKTEGPDFELPSSLQPLAPLKDDLLVLSGLAQKQAASLGDGPGDHARSASAFLTGCHPRKTSGANIKVGTSADQIAAEKLGFETLFPSLELGCEPSRQAGNCDSGYSCAYSSTISWRSESQPMAKETQPRLVFERLFGSANSAENAQNRFERFRYQRSILDYVRADASRLSKQLGGSDARKLDEYLTGVREIERRLGQAERIAQQPPRAMDDVGTVDDYAFEGYGEQLRLMTDLIALAFQGDLTRIATFMLANEGSNRTYPMIDVKDGHHSLSHHGKNPEKLTALEKINRFHVEHLSHLLTRLAEMREGESRLLDNCLIMYGSGISDGDRHNHDDLPILLAGQGGGSLDTGRHVRYEAGTPLNNLFVSMLGAMGAGNQLFGDATGPLPGLVV